MEKDLRILEEKGYAEFIEAVVNKSIDGARLEGFYRDVYEYLIKHYKSLKFLLKNQYRQDAYLQSLVEFHDQNCPELYAMAVALYTMAKDDFGSSYILR